MANNESGNPPPHPPLAPLAPRPGYTTTELALTIVAMVLGAVMASGWLPESSMWSQIVGLAVAVLAQLGYTAGRAITKSAEAKAAAHVEATRVQAAAIERSALDPTRPRPSNG